MTIRQFQAQKILPILTALAEGKEIEYNYPEDGWRTVTEVDIVRESVNYRVKPRRVWVVYKNGELHSVQPVEQNLECLEGFTQVYMEEVSK